MNAPPPVERTLGWGGRFLHGWVRSAAVGLVVLAFLGPWLGPFWNLAGWAYAAIVLAGGAPVLLVHTVVRGGPAKRRALLATAALSLCAVLLVPPAARAGSALALERRRPHLDRLADALEEQPRIHSLRGDPLFELNGVYVDAGDPAVEKALAREGIDPRALARAEALRARAGSPEVRVEKRAVLFVYGYGGDAEGVLRVRPGAPPPRTGDRGLPGSVLADLEPLGGRWFAFRAH